MTRARAIALQIVIAMLALSKDPEPAIAAGIPEPIHNPYTQVVLSPACADVELQRLKREIERIAGKRRPENAWALAKLMLCNADDEQSRGQLARSMPERVAVAPSGTGADIGPWTRLESRSVVTPLGGHVWGVSVAAKGADIVLAYSPSQDCSAQIRLRYVAGTWLLVARLNDCD